MVGSDTNRLASPSIPENNDVVVIGSGLGGLACALELARNGLKVCMFEQYSAAGGYAHSFRRKGYHFDISMHHIGGLAPGNLTHDLLSSLGIFERLRCTRRDNLFTAEFPGFEATLPNRPEDILEELGTRFESERTGLSRLFDILTSLKADVIGPTLNPDFDKPFEERISTEYLESTLGDIISTHISDPNLIAILGQIWMLVGLPPSQSAATFSTCVFCSSFIEGAYYITGGGGALARVMVKRLRELGGECILRAGVKRIVVEKGAATGVELEDGQFIKSRVVVSNANPHHTFFDLVSDDDISKIYRYRIEQMDSSLSSYSLFLGLDCLPSRFGIPEGNLFHSYKADCDDAYRRAMAHEIDETDWYATSYENTDDSMCPAGTGIVSFVELTPARDWIELDNETYASRKQEVEKRLLAKYAKRFPGIEDHIAVSEFATPRTMARYTRNRHGAVYGLAQTLEQASNKRLRNRSPIERLFLTGAWTWFGGGYEGSIVAGIQTADSVLSEIDAPAPASRVRIAASQGQNGDLIKDEIEKRSIALGDLDPDDDYYRYRLKVRVFGDDMNSKGNADASSYLRYMDRGRVEAIEEVCRKVGKESWLKEFIVNVYRIDAECAIVVGLGDWLEVQTGLRKTSSHRAAFDQRIVRKATGEVVADAVIEVLFLNDERHLVPVPEELTGRGPDESKTSIERKEPVPFSDEAHFPFRTLFRVYYEDTDCQEITYHVSYARYCERALFELVGAVWPEMKTQIWISEHKVGIARIDLRYLNSSTLGDYLEVRTGVLGVTSHRIVFGQRIAFQDSGKVIADVTNEVEFRDENDVPVPIPRQALDATLGALPQNGIRPPK
ncbi:MAG: FAD-binding protein [Deltaproteobacteria bacterium]|nr:FAD-binding protein [Deltaproteobacteria bacterium]